ncbi:MAG: 4Fe-4S binding protein [Desulfuromonadales bacterium]|nr:4Fe-4S binding protein [Desulfuromonadales bacterium]
MGHLHNGKSSLVPLIDRLNKYPIGLVDSAKLRQILALLFSEEEALVASRFPLEEATLPELAKRTGLPAIKLAGILESMAEKGLVMDMPCAGTTYYLLMPGLIGFFEFTFMKQRADLPLAELAKLMREYLEECQAPEFFGSKTQLTRSLVYAEHVPVTSKVTSYEDARQIIAGAGYGAVGLCYCRHKKEHEKKVCAKGAPVEEICISLGNAARFMVRRGFASERTTDELLAILDRARTYNLTHITDNIRHKPSFICNCCSCCCELLAGVQMGYPDGIAKTGFTVAIDTERCNGCGRCYRACNVKALAMAQGERYAELQRALCLGCGACIGVCPQGALQLVELAKRPLPPHKRKDLFVKMLREKGRMIPYLLLALGKSVRNLLGIEKKVLRRGKQDSRRQV